MLLLERLKDKEQFSDLDLAVVNYVLDNPKEVTDMTVGELARVTYTSPSSIVRLCKKLGMKGYSDFRIKLATEINAFLINEEKIETEMPIRPNADFNEVTKTFLNLHYQALVNTYNMLDQKAINEAVELLYNAQSISIKGFGPSLLIGQDFGWKLDCIGFPITSSALSGFDTVRITRNTTRNVGVIVSNYGIGSGVRDWMYSFKSTNTKVIMICSNKNSKTFQQADVKILLESNEEDRTQKLGAFASRTAATYVLDIIYALIYQKDYNLNVKYQYEYGKIIRNLHRYKEDSDF